MRFFTRELLHKWGFEDGDIIDALLDAHGFDLAKLNTKDVLCAIVRDHVLPVLINKVEVKEICTMHNPIRITSVDGMPIDNMKTEHPEVELQPEFVDVSDELVLEYARRSVSR